MAVGADRLAPERLFRLGPVVAPRLEPAVERPLDDVPLGWGVAVWRFGVALLDALDCEPAGVSPVWVCLTGVESGGGLTGSGGALTGRGGVLTDGVVTLGVVTDGTLTVPTVTGGVVTEGAVAAGTLTVGTESVGTLRVGTLTVGTEAAEGAPGTNRAAPVTRTAIPLDIANRLRTGPQSIRPTARNLRLHPPSRTPPPAEFCRANGETRT